MTRQSKLFLNSDWVDGDQSYSVKDKFHGGELANVHVPSREQLDSALKALKAEQAGTQLSQYDRGTILDRASSLLADRRDEFVDVISSEGGFTRKDAAGEITRAIGTLKLCAEEARRIVGEMIPLDGAMNGQGRLGFTVLKPRGLVCAITPFNSPLNTVIHKVGPAIAAGNAVVLKPSDYTPVTGELLVRLLLDSGLPPGMIGLVHGPGSTVGTWLVESPEPDFYAFTGSTEVGRMIQAKVGLRPLQLELGSIASTIVCADADLDVAADKCVAAAFRKAGQICTSVQRLYVDESIVDGFVAEVVDRLSGLVAGDPSDPDTFIGPLIDISEAERVQGWVEEAVGGGASCLAGGRRDGAVIEPTLLDGVEPTMAIMSQEIFGPVVAVRRFSQLNEAIEEVNDTPFGLAAGVFTGSIATAWESASRLRMGSVHINETSNSRLDMMPYSGVKASGMGREGPRYAIHEMMEECLVTIRR